MKYNYLEIKNQYTKDNKYLAVINDNGLWIKDTVEGKSMIIHSDKINKNILKNTIITIFDGEFRNEESVIAAKEASIISKNWILNEAIIIDSAGKKEFKEKLNLETSFDYKKINSLFSNLESLNLIQLFNQKKDFEFVGLNTADLEIQINKILSIPASLVIFCLLSSILMFNVKFKRSMTFMLISGILLSVIIYYIYYFFGLLGNNNKIPVLLAIWLPNIVLFLCCIIGIININEK